MMNKKILTIITVMGVTILSGSNIATATEKSPELLEMELTKTADYIKNLEKEISVHPDYEPAQKNLSIMKESYTKANTLYAMLSNLNDEDDARCGAIAVNANNSDFMDEINIQIKNIYSLPNTIDYFNGYYDLDDWRKDIVNTASKAEGKIVYKWDNKPQKAEWHSTWDNKETGLDCSGFVAWVYWNSTNNQNTELYSTFSITKTQEPITYEELLPGDLGTFLAEGTYYTTIQNTKYYTIDEVKVEYEEYCISSQSSQNSISLEEYYKTSTNHVGIYAGKDENRKDIWIHCKGKPENTVVVNNCEKFKYFFTVKGK